MRAMVTAFVATAVISVGAWFALSERLDYSAATRTSAQESVRLD